MTDQKLTRRTSLVRIGGVLATALGAAGIDARGSEGSGPAAVASGDVALRARSRSRRKVRTTSLTKPYAATSPRAGPEPAAAPRVRRQRLHLQADQGCGRRHLARRCRRRLLGVRARGREPHVHARRQRTSAKGLALLSHGLPGLVSGPHRAHPREGAPRRQRRAHRSALLPRLGHGRRLREGPIHQPRRIARRVTPTTRSTETAASAHRSACARRAQASMSRRSRWASTALNTLPLDSAAWSADAARVALARRPGRPRRRRAALRRTPRRARRRRSDDRDLRRARQRSPR